MDCSFLTPARKVYLKQDLSLWCIVDEIDYQWIVQHNWNWGCNSSARVRARKLYAKRNVGKSRTTIWLHRAIQQKADPKPALFTITHQVDHINGQTLDNRRHNLRWVTPSENRRNQVPRIHIPSLQWVWQNLCHDCEVPDLVDAPF